MNSLLRSFTTAVLLAVIQHGDADSFTCYQCASLALQNQWQITGLQLPSTVNPLTFFHAYKDCLQADPTDGNTPVISGCADFCFTLIVSPAMLNGTNAAGDSLVVRGCHKDFTNFGLNPGQSVVGTGSTNYGLCEYGNIRRYNNLTQAVDTPAAYQWCNANIAGTDKSYPCNKFDNVNDIKTTMTGCNPNSKTPIPCYDCVEGSTVKPCTSATTNTSPYCYKSDLWINNQHFITRSLSDINPLFPGATGTSGTTQPQVFEGKCGYVSQAYPIQTRSGTVSIQGYDCYCNFQNLCNGASQVAFSFVTVSLAALSLYFFKN